VAFLQAAAITCSAAAPIAASFAQSLYVQLMVDLLNL
jgi:hypothetical protein